jgi:hypothetical protein
MFTGSVAEGLEWLEPYCRDSLGLAASIVVLLNMSQYASFKTAFHRRLFEAYKDGFADCWEYAQAYLDSRPDEIDGEAA